jgi:hypothetical protein
LLQNWWKNKLFVEVSADYFHGCRAKIRFVNKPLTSFGKCCDEVVSPFVPFAETCVDRREKLIWCNYSTMMANRRKVE